MYIHIYKDREDRRTDEERCNVKKNCEDITVEENGKKNSAYTRDVMNDDEKEEGYYRVKYTEELEY